MSKLPEMFPMPFSVGDIVRFCEFLEKNGELDRLSRFLWSLPYSVREISASEPIAVFSRGCRISYWGFPRTVPHPGRTSFLRNIPRKIATSLVQGALHGGAEM